MATIPYGALTGFVLAADIREVAAYYSVRAKGLRRPGRTVSPVMHEARAALFWKLTHQRGLSPARAAQLLGGVAPDTVRRGAAAHAQRIAEAIATVGQVTQGLVGERDAA